MLFVGTEYKNMGIDICGVPEDVAESRRKNLKSGLQKGKEHYISILEEKKEKIKMVKVTIENDKNKDEITGEFFMGLMLTKEEETEDSTTYKACAIGRGDTCVQDLPNNVAK